MKILPVEVKNEALSIEMTIEEAMEDDADGGYFEDD